MVLKLFFFWEEGILEEFFLNRLCLKYVLLFEFMFFKFLIKLLVNLFKDVEYMFGEFENCCGELIVYCFNNVCLFFERGKLNGVLKFGLLLM